MDIFAKKLRELREEQRYSQSEMAKKLDVSQSYYSKFELDQGEPNLETLVRIADIFKVSLDYLLGRTGIDTFEGKEKVAQDLERRIGDLEKFIFNQKKQIK